MNTRILLAAALVIGLLMFTAAQAQKVYRWVDPQGDVHYSQTPPPGAGTHAKLVNVAPAPPNITAAHAQQAMVKSVAAANTAKQQAADKAAQAAAKKARRRKACNAARQKLKGYMQAHRVITNAGSAKPTYYTGENLVKFRKQAQKQVNQLCTGS